MQLELNRHQVKHLEALQSTGLYGFAIEDVAIRLLDGSLINAIKQRHFQVSYDKGDHR